MNKESFRIMDLPGELRNGIYDMAIETEEPNRSFYLYHEPEVAKAFKYASHRQQRQFMGLTQANRAIRAEFLPIYSKSYKPMILSYKLPEYLLAYPLKDIEAMGKMVALAQSLRNCALDIPGVDIKPLLVLDWTSILFGWVSTPPLTLSGKCLTVVGNMLEYFRRKPNSLALRALSATRGVGIGVSAMFPRKRKNDREVHLGKHKRVAYGAKPQGSGFMELPGEIRNRIYDCMLADDPPNHVILLFHEPQPRGSFRRRNIGRLYLGLTQANKILRSEFLPLYSHNRKPSVPFTELAKLLSKYPLPDQPTNQIVLGILSALETDLPLPPGIDITPLVHVDWKALPFFPYFDYNTRSDSERVRVTCRLLWTLDTWKHLVKASWIISIGIAQRDNQPVVLTMKLKNYPDPTHALACRKTFLQDFIRLAGLVALRERRGEGRHMQRSIGRGLIVECTSGWYKLSCIPGEDMKQVLLHEKAEED